MSKLINYVSSWFYTTEPINNTSVIEDINTPIQFKKYVINDNINTQPNNVLQFNGTEFTHIVDGDNVIWFIGNEVTKCLGYKKNCASVFDRIKIDNRYTCKYKNFNHPQLRWLKKGKKTNNLKNVLCINEFGLYQLLSKSELKNPIVTEFQQWLYEDALPSIRKIDPTAINNIEPINDNINTQLSNDVLNLQHNSMFDGKSLTAINVNGNYWFKGKDIALMLEYKDTKSAIEDHVETDDKKKYSNFFRGGKTPPRKKEQQHTIYVNESGLYSLILSSKKPIAKQFKHWITSDVLPQLRETGNYISNTDTLNETINSKPKQKQLQHFKNHSTNVMDAIKGIDIQNIYQNKTDIKTAQELFNNHSFRLNNDDKHNHLLYFYLTSYNYHIGDKVCLTCKIGYTSGSKLDSRTEGLINEYNCKFFLIDYKVIDNIQCEQRFHDYLKEKYAELTIDDIDKKELYVFTAELLNEFYKFPNFVCSSHLELEKEKTKQLELQLRMKEIELQMMQLKKNNRDTSTTDTCIYKQYLDERTEWSNANIHMRTLYSDFVTWLTDNKLGHKIHNNDEFTNGIRKHVDVAICMYVKGSHQTTGVLNLQLKNIKYGNKNMYKNMYKN
jgi:prophage antirepressor-like protein